MTNGIGMRLLAASFAAACAACATTTFQTTWKSPDAMPLRLSGRKVVAVFVHRDPLLRRRAEDAMVREINARGAEGVPAYTFLSDAELHDRDAAKAKADALGCAGAVVMRVVGSETRYVAPSGYVWLGPEYRRFWGGYWGWGWGAAWPPMRPSVDHVVKVETLVYSLEQDVLVWGGVSRTVDPGHIDDFIAELAAAVSKQMADDGVLTRG